MPVVWHRMFPGKRLSVREMFLSTVTYLDIDVGIVWETMVQGLPVLKSAIVQLLRKLEEVGDEG